MQKFTFLFVLSFLSISLFAQVRLDVEGDAKVVGKMDIINAVGDSSLFIGANAGSNDVVGFGITNYNTFVGTSAGATNTTGSHNSFFGSKAGGNNVTGADNAFFGMFAGNRNTVGHLNAFFGSFAGTQNNTGVRNAFFGASAGALNTIGTNNSFFGTNAGGYNRRGSHNTYIGSLSGTLWGVDSLDRTIAIGYEAIVDCHNCAVIGGTGVNAVNVGIGTNTPTEKLDIVTDGDLSIKATAGDGRNSSLILYEEGDFGFEFIYDGSAFNKDLRLLHRKSSPNGSGSTTIARVTWRNDGDMDIHGDLDVIGSLYQNGSLILSDQRYKKQIKKIDNSLALLHRINGVSYAFKNQEFATRNFSIKRTFGVIAQEVEKVFPTLVHEHKEGYKAVNYDGLIPVLIEATKEQQQLIDQQKETLKSQSQQLADQQQQINELKGVVEKLLVAPAAPQKTNNHTLPLLQKASLGQNQPNPFNETTLIDYYLPRNIQNAKVQVTTLGGKVLGEVVLPGKGKGQVNIQAQTYPAGTYYYSLIVDGQIVETKKMVLMK